MDKLQMLEELQNRHRALINTMDMVTGSSGRDNDRREDLWRQVLDAREDLLSHERELKKEREDNCPAHDWIHISAFSNQAEHWFCHRCFKQRY